MANANVEIEIKLPLYNGSEVKDFLNSNAKLVHEWIYQKDSYYVPAHRDFLAVRYPAEWLRLRTSKKWACITYKHFYPEWVEVTDYCDEFETKIESLETMEKIFRGLDIREVAVVEKTRSSWLYEDVEISIDEVTDLWIYMELEATWNFEDPKDGKKYLYEILGKLEARVGAEENQGYPYRILEKQGYKF